MFIKNVAALLAISLIMLSGERCALAAVTGTIRVSTSASAGGTISPTYKDVKKGSIATFTVSPLFGYSAEATGCGGTLKGTNYKTAAITAKCTVEATFTPLPMSLAISSKALTKPVSYKRTTGVINFSVSGATTKTELLGLTEVDQSWLRVDALTYDRKGKGSLSYTVFFNNSINPRTGSITVAGATFDISQSGRPCTFTFTSKPSTSFPVTGGTTAVTVTVVPSDAVWSVSAAKWLPATATDWLHGFTLDEQKTGADTLMLTADFNSTGATRSVMLTFASSDGKSKKTLTVNQATRTVPPAKVNYISAVSSSFNPTTATAYTSAITSATEDDGATIEKFVPIHWWYKVNGGRPIYVSMDGIDMGLTITSSEKSISPSDFKRKTAMSGTLSGKYSGVKFSGKYQATIYDLLLMTDGDTYLRSEFLSMGINISASGRSASINVTSNVKFNAPYQLEFLDRDDLDQLSIGDQFTTDSSGTVGYKVTATGEKPISETGIAVNSYYTWTVVEKLESMSVQGKTYSNVVKVQVDALMPDEYGEQMNTTMYYWLAKGIGIIKGQEALGFLDAEDVVTELVNTNLTQ